VAKDFQQEQTQSGRTAPPQRQHTIHGNVRNSGSAQEIGGPPYVLQVCWLDDRPFNGL
jgi:hypothetical protein